jgi:hypothetical protein
MIFSENRFPLFRIMLRNRARTSDVDNLDLAAFAVYIGFIIAALSIRASLALARLCLINLANRRRSSHGCEHSIREGKHVGV